MAVDYLETIGALLLDALTDGLAFATTGRPAPTKTYLSHGPPAWDECCDGLAVVYLDPNLAVSHTSESGIPQDCAIVPTATWVLEWARCVPTIADGVGWPSDDDLDTSASDLLADLWAVLTELYDRRAAGTLLPGESGCRDVTIGDAVPIVPSGGCAGWQVRVMMVLNDPGPAGS